MQRDRADHADEKLRRTFYWMMNEIAKSMDHHCNFLKELSALPYEPQVLDLCMAPGGFTATTLRHDHRAKVHGISLPVESGGHPMMMPDWVGSKRLAVLWLDITMLSSELGIPNIPPDHPDFSSFSTLRPWYGQQFDLIFCDGAVLRTQDRANYRGKMESTRLLTSQLVLAFQRIKPGGTLICRLHKIEGVDTANLLCVLEKLSSMQVWKPPRAHITRSSFYVIAKGVQPQSPEGIRAINEWKKIWSDATLNTAPTEESHSFDSQDPSRIQDAEEIVRSFGQKLINLVSYLSSNPFMLLMLFRTLDGEAPGRH
jgi:23S rRNA U2552 (ribose-2'-O)-methylase RlmE/FtsJ